MTSKVRKVSFLRCFWGVPDLQLTPSPPPSVDGLWQVMQDDSTRRDLQDGMSYHGFLEVGEEIWPNLTFLGEVQDDLKPTVNFSRRPVGKNQAQNS